MKKKSKSLGEVVAEPSTGGGRRLRCVTCNKVAFPSEEIASEAVEKIKERGGKMSYYLGPDCGWWHLTRQGG